MTQRRSASLAVKIYVVLCCVCFEKKRHLTNIGAEESTAQPHAQHGAIMGDLQCASIPPSNSPLSSH